MKSPHNPPRWRARAQAQGVRPNAVAAVALGQAPGDGDESDESPTVDGRNPAPVDRWFIPLFIGFQPSKVVQDFSHQQ